MDIGVISVRYARALLKSATDARVEDSVYRQMQLLAKSYVEVPQLRQNLQGDKAQMDLIDRMLDDVNKQ